MRAITSIVGIVLVIVGILSLAYGGFNYTTRDQVAQVGDVTITADTDKRVYLSPLAGGACLVAGLALVYFSRRK